MQAQQNRTSAIKYLLGEVDGFSVAIEACTIPVPGGREVIDKFAAEELSSRWSALHLAVGAVQYVLIDEAGVFDEDAENELEETGVCMRSVPAGPGGIELPVMSAIQGALFSFAWTPERQAEEEERPDEQRRGRFRAGKVLTSDRLERWASVPGMIRLELDEADLEAETLSDDRSDATRKRDSSSGEPGGDSPDGEVQESPAPVPQGPAEMPLRGWASICKAMKKPKTRSNQANIKRLNKEHNGPIYWAERKPHVHLSKLHAWLHVLEDKQRRAEEGRQSREGAAGELAERDGQRAPDHNMHIEARPNAKGKARPATDRS